jgi:hypothetical protein
MSSALHSSPDADRQPSPEPGRVADIDATIELWQRSGVDFCDAWWALGRRKPCWGGWPDVRTRMVRVAIGWERQGQGRN